MSVKDWNEVGRRIDKVWMNLQDGQPNILVAMFVLNKDAVEWAAIQTSKAKGVTYEVEEGSR